MALLEADAVLGADAAPLLARPLVDEGLDLVQDVVVVRAGAGVKNTFLTPSNLVNGNGSLSTNFGLQGSDYIRSSRLTVYATAQRQFNGTNHFNLLITSRPL